MDPGHHRGERDRGADAETQAGTGPIEDLVLLINGGVFEDRPWTGFLRALRTRIGAGYANIIFRRPGSVEEGLTEWVDCDADADPEAIRQSYFASFSGRDPFPYFRMKPGLPMRMPDLMGSADYGRNPYFTGFLKPHGLEHMVLFRAVEPGGHQAWLTLTRPRDGRDFPAWVDELCARLAPHFSVALRAYGELEAARITRATRERVMRMVNLGCVSLDARRLLVRGEPHLAGPRRDGLPVRLDSAGKLRLTAPEADRQLARALEEIDSGLRTDPLAIVVGGIGGAQVLVVPLTLAVAQASTAIANLYFQLPDDPEQFGPGFERLLREIYGLGGSEAALAACLMRGMDLAEAADAVGLTRESARTYSKRIFAKTGTTGQSDLVRSLLRSVAALA